LVCHLRLKLRDARAQLADSDERVEAFTVAAESFAGHDNESQRIRYHHKVKDDRDRLKGEVERGGVELRRMEQALQLLCSVGAVHVASS
jgi:hypothetical protein